VFYYFPNNYTWSSAVMLCLMASGQLGQIDRWLAPLRDGDPDDNAWTTAWDNAAAEQEEHANSELQQGFTRSASARCLRAATYYLTGERQTPPGPAKTRSYAAALRAFAAAMRYSPHPAERIEIDSADGLLPGHLIPTHADRPAPVVVFYNGFDVTKEILYSIIGHRFADRGIACLVIDTPGTGEPLRLRGVASRPDYEVPTSAIVDYLQTRDDLDATRIGLLGISLGGHYAPRGAAYERRIRACAAWGGVYDYGAVWQHRWESSSRTTSVPFWQLPWVMGTDTMEQALNRVKQWTLADALPHLTQPLLIVHGEHDQAIPVQDASRAHAEAGSVDKQLRIFTQAEGGSEHCNADDPDPARQLIADWFADRLGTIPARHRATATAGRSSNDHIGAGFDGEYVPSPDKRAREQVSAYEASGGVEGATLEGKPVVILTSLGAKSGKVRKNPVMRIVDGDRYIAVASAAGSPKNPSWYANLVAHPVVRLQDGAVIREFRAREVAGEEKTYFWAVTERFWPHFPEYRRLAQGRDIPIMVLEPVTDV
jgi:deazaflavin-dependent oxidoreductase (nitroreductase family)